MPIIDRLYQTYLTSRTVTTDSRKITPGCIFFAFKGEHFDGNAFAPKALEQGAAYCVIRDPQYKVDDRCIVVPDVLSTLQELAREIIELAEDITPEHLAILLLIEALAPSGLSAP